MISDSIISLDKDLLNERAVSKAILHRDSVYVTNDETSCNHLIHKGLPATVLKEGVEQSKLDLFNGAAVNLITDQDSKSGSFFDMASRALKGHAFSISKVVVDSLEQMSTLDISECVKSAEETLPDYFINNKVNVGLFADSILSTNHILVYQDPGTGVDMAYWYKGGVYQFLPESVLQAKIRALIPSQIATPVVVKNTAQMVLMTAKHVRYEDLDSNEDLVNLKCGLYDVKNGKLLQHTPDVLSTIQLKVNSVDTKIPDIWISYIEDLCRDSSGEVDTEMVDYLQEWTGYILSSIKGKRIKKALVLHAAMGNSGKSVFINVISNILGREHVANTDLHKICSDRWGTGLAFGKRLIAIGDQDGEPIASSENFKFMTGGDGISAEKKGIQGFNYVFNGLFLIGSNAFPIFKDDKGTHVVERLTLLPCRHTVPRETRDPMLEDKLNSETDGIFTWAMEGLRRFLNNGMHFSKCESSEKLTEEYRGRYDTLYFYIQERCKLTTDYKDYVYKSDLEEEYESFCEEEGLTALNRRNIKSRIESYGVTTSVLHGRPVYRGIRKADFVSLEDPPPF